MNPSISSGMAMGLYARAPAKLASSSVTATTRQSMIRAQVWIDNFRDYFCVVITIYPR